MIIDRYHVIQREPGSVEDSSHDQIVLNVAKQMQPVHLVRLHGDELQLHMDPVSLLMHQVVSHVEVLVHQYQKFVPVTTELSDEAIREVVVM
jgi:hypothetical protein